MEQPISKSQKRRDAEALQRFGVALINLRVDQIKQLTLPVMLEQAIIEAKSLKSHGAKRRQAQLIGKRMRHTDIDILLIMEKYARLQGTHTQTLLSQFDISVDPRSVP